MYNAKLFKRQGKDAGKEILSHKVKKEKTAERFFVENLENVLGVKFLEDQFIGNDPTRNKIVDTLAIDDNKYPTIIEYKKGGVKGIVVQALSYYKWLVENKGEFYLLVKQKFGIDVADSIDWSNPRIILVAEDFHPYDVDAVEVIQRNIDLVRYQYFDDGLIMIQPVYVGSKENYQTRNPAKVNGGLNRRSARLLNEKWSHFSLYRELVEATEKLGNDVTILQTKAYVAGRTSRNFVVFQAMSKHLRVCVDLDKESVDYLSKNVNGHDVKTIPSHFKPGLLTVYINLHNNEDIDIAKSFIERAYEKS